MSILRESVGFLISLEHMPPDTGIAQQADHGNNIKNLQVSQRSQRKCLETVEHYLYMMDIIFTQPSVSSYKLVTC